MPLREGEVYGEITEAGLSHLLERKGVKRADRQSMFAVDDDDMPALAALPKDWSFFMVSDETVQRLARGIGDTNKLYMDNAYAARSIWGRVLLPPASLCWTQTVNGASEGFAGCHTIWRGVEWELEHPLCAGELLKSRTYLTDARIVDSDFAGGTAAAATQDYETETFDGAERYIGSYRTFWHRFSRGKAKEKSKYAGQERHTWTDEELEEVWAEYDAFNLANRRGAEALWWEDVAEGDEVPHIIKGPLTLTSKIAFEMWAGAFGWFVGHELARKLWARKPNLPIRNEENVPEPPVAIHWTNERCESYLGMPGAYEAGFERMNWLTQLLMSWMGDRGMIRKVSLQFRGFHWQGDAVRLYATVVTKRVEDGRRLVDLDVWTVSHPRGDRTTEGTAVVQLPGRDDDRPVWTPADLDSARRP